MRVSRAVILLALFTAASVAPGEGTKHWSFEPPVQPAVPRVSDEQWSHNPIDAFVHAEHLKRGLKPAREADRATLLRRVYVDLIGIPPSRQQLAAFLQDNSPGAYERVVDQLLASPQYGERWGRHWMDVWRYSDWAGYMQEVRDSQPHIWRWRDWIVESLNADKPYDRMVQEMLAGDELAPDDPATLRATGYLVRSWYKFNRNVWLENTVEHTSKAFLALTVNCAKCHDHKYDPISQKDHYRFRAFFEAEEVRTDRVPGQADTTRDGLVRVYDAHASDPTYVFARGNEMDPIKEDAMSPAVPAVLGGSVTIQPVSLPSRAHYPGVREFEQRESIESAESALDNARAELGRAEKEAESAKDKSTAEARLRLATLKVQAAQTAQQFAVARVAADKARYAMPPEPNADELARTAARLERVSAVAGARVAVAQAEMDQKKGAKDSQKKLTDAKKALGDAEAAVEKSSDSYSPLGPVYPATSTGRRLALARWITSRDNPLAARVSINHIWMRHFGEPIVPTVFDFGMNGRPPTNQALLDWLAVELMEGAPGGKPWGMKAIHRLIVTSATYRMASFDPDVEEHDRKIDPDNEYLWRANVKRLESEAVRDSLLAVSGQLDLTMGGPEIDQKAGFAIHRRSIYFRQAMEKQMVFLGVFDAPSPGECYRRMPTVMPQQALALSNSTIAQACARRLAEALTKEAGHGDPRFIRIAYEQVLSRAPSEQEQTTCSQFLSDQSRRLGDAPKLSAFTTGDNAAVKPSTDPHQRAREDLVQVLLNHNDFVTVR